MGRSTKKKRTKEYDPKLSLKDRVEWKDLIDLSLQDNEAKPVKGRTKPAKKK